MKRIQEGREEWESDARDAQAEKARVCIKQWREFKLENELEAQRSCIEGRRREGCDIIYRRSSLKSRQSGAGAILATQRRY
jgi:hypothetical protein